VPLLVEPAPLLEPALVEPPLVEPVLVVEPLPFELGPPVELLPAVPVVPPAELLVGVPVLEPELVAEVVLLLVVEPPEVVAATGPAPQANPPPRMGRQANDAGQAGPASGVQLLPAYVESGRELTGHAARNSHAAAAHRFRRHPTARDLADPPRRRPPERWRCPLWRTERWP